MPDPASTQVSSSGKPSAAQVAQGNPLAASGARWFWWIAGLSLVNTVLYQTGAKMSFVVGLGVTLVSDIALANNRPLGYAVDAIAMGFFVWMGWLAARGKLAAFYVGLVVYALDALIYVKYQSWLPVGFHVVAGYFIVRGALSLRQALHAAG